MNMLPRHTIECDGKDAMTRQQAKTVERRMKASNKPVTAYRCHTCRQWHVGQTVPKAFRERKPI